eukprot:TRINITY_DN17496_c0_g2_i1.p1 TRINITY_DN17496_c0_g2~~TRINITY_DN17496_c0_g2_i1.p1  ORF type:complete len:257 (+),score=33.66 TRINITY_DN17496_c0_g2_i1:79-849(+)
MCIRDRSNNISKMMKYEEVEMIGEGAFSKVYKVRDSATKKEYAMKVISTKKTDLEKFKNEVALMKKLNSLANPNIVRYITSDIQSQKYVIIMEYCSNGNLRDLIEKHKIEKKEIPEDAIVNYARQILAGLSVLHKNGIIHRDLKPDNIMIDSAGKLKLSDFGVSKQLLNILEYTNTAIGTLWYSSLEVIKGEKYDFSVDIWALGCILHELCCLVPPFTETNLYDFVERLRKKKYDPSAIPKPVSYTHLTLPTICSV